MKPYTEEEWVCLQKLLRYACEAEEVCSQEELEEALRQYRAGLTEEDKRGKMDACLHRTPPSRS